MLIITGVLSGFFGSFLVFVFLRIFAKKDTTDRDLFFLRTKYEERTAVALEKILEVLEYNK